MGLRLKGQVLKFDVVDKCNRKFASDCEVTFPEKVPVTYNFSPDEIIGHADISKVEDGLNCEVSLFDTNALPQNEYFVGGYYTRVKTHVKDHITIIDSARSELSRFGNERPRSHDPAAECWHRPSEVYADAGCLCRHYWPAVLVERVRYLRG